nr:Chain C, APC C-terminus peptide [Homo sapiens]6MS1_D Chain D, APC C-terminus peptide [Homo sapiens]
GSYLVTSV